MSLVNHNKLLVILGSTSTGKTDLALQLAKKFNGELISCDSRQVYKGLDIGTGKMPGKEVAVKKGEGFWEMDEVKVWMYDVVDPKKYYSVADYVKAAQRVIRDVCRRKKLPIIVGGTGFYLKALLEGLPNLVVPVDKSLRKKLQRLSKEQLQKKLQKIASDKWRRLNASDRQNPRRLIRAIEISSQVDINAAAVSLLLTGDRFKFPADILKIGLTAPREVLYERIDERVVDRINQGMVEEAERLHRVGLSLKRMRQLGLEYEILADYLAGKIRLKEELINRLQGKIHGFARRQITWFKKEKGVLWFDITKSAWLAQVESKIDSWYYSLK